MSDEWFTKIETKLDKISDNLSELKTGQAVMQLDVAHHVKRSDMLEDLVQHIEENRIQPIEKELASLKGSRKSAKWFIGTFIAFGATVAAFLLLRH